MSDIHFGPYVHWPQLAQPGEDTDPALLASLFRELRTVAPKPAVVFIPGDFLAHGLPPSLAGIVMVDLARRFDALYPHAQFAITLGNNDSDCGDYARPSGAFIDTVARAWAPLVERGGRAPDFVAQFERDGAYAARLPVPHLR
ncbi:MAG: metallophosphoesterase, partial [Vulcanimicrobiaceae bacterium]